MNAQAVVDELLELYAIDGLDAHETALFEASLGDLPAAHREAAVAEIRRTRDAVGRMAAELAEEPDPSTRAAILRAVTDFSDAPVPAIAAASGDRAPSASHADNDDLAARRNRRRWSVSIASAAAAVVLIVGGILVGRASISTPHSPPPVAASDNLAPLRAVMSQPDVRVHRTEMNGAPGTAIVASSRSTDTAVMLLDGSIPPPAGREYQLWLIGNRHAPKSVGLLTTGEPAPIVIHGLSASRTVGMTTEPTGGSPAPTGAVLAAVPI